MGLDEDLRAAFHSNCYNPKLQQDQTGVPPAGAAWHGASQAAPPERQPPKETHLGAEAAVKHGVCFVQHHHLHIAIVQVRLLCGCRERGKRKGV